MVINAIHATCTSSEDAEYAKRRVFSGVHLELQVINQ